MAHLGGTYIEQLRYDALLERDGHSIDTARVMLELWTDTDYTVDVVDAEALGLDDCELCGKLDELSHNDNTGLALCLNCDNDNQ